jgi:Tfp pilus assembly protein PilN
MIKVNLVGATKRKPVKVGGGPKLEVPTNLLPIVLFLIVVGTAVGGYMWYSSLSTQTANLDATISNLQAQKAALDAVIKENAIYEARKKALENRIKVIEGLKRNQVNPIVALDVLSEAIERTKFVWLTQLDQNNATLSMNGVGTSVNAIADFVTYLESTHYFRNPELAHATDSAGNFTFSLKCEFAPPSNMPVTATDDPVTRGGN